VSEYVCEKTNKERFSKEEAISRAVWWRRNRAARMQAYRCTHCGAWHIGNNRSKPKHKRR
jgi:hypothetical protein